MKPLGFDSDPGFTASRVILTPEGRAVAVFFVGAEYTHSLYSQKHHINKA
jgi:hypothetical protein